MAALYYAAVAAGNGDLSRAQTSVVIWTTIVCVAVSVTVHGIAATPLTRALLDR